MKLNEARQLILCATAKGAQVELSSDGKYVRVMEFEYTDTVIFQALNALIKEGVLIQLTTAKQKTSAVSFKRSGT